MFESVQHRHSESEPAAAVDIAPLIDMAFTLLVFFLMTTTFVRDRGIDVTRPEAFETVALAPRSLRINITASGVVYADGRQIDSIGCREVVRKFMAQERDGTVVIIPDEQVSAKRLVAVMDAAKQGGAIEIALSTRQKSER